MIKKWVTIRLKPGRERPLLRGHPWIFSGAIDKVEGEADDQLALADVLDANGVWLGRGAWDGRSGLAVRVYTHNPDESLNSEFWAKRIRAAIQRRAKAPFLRDNVTNAYRLVFSESDRLSGLVVDRYGDTLCVQIGSRVWHGWLEDVMESLKRETGLTKYWVQGEPDSVAREQLTIAGPDLTQPVPFKECGHNFEIAPDAKQKTGFYLDQRENRRRVAAYCAERRVLSAFCFTGAFEVYAAAAGATDIVGVDRSESAIRQARRHHELNPSNANVEYRVDDVGRALRTFRDEGRTFDVIILDPPRFVAGRNQKEKGLRAYKDANLLAMKLLASSGILATFSCSGQISRDEFKTMIEWAAADAKREVQILEQLSQPADHPVLVGFPESEYLKGFICAVE